MAMCRVARRSLSLPARFRPSPSLAVAEAKVELWRSGAGGGNAADDAARAIRSSAQVADLERSLAAKVAADGGSARAEVLARVSRIVRNESADISVVAGQAHTIEAVRRSFRLDVDRAERSAGAHPDLADAPEPDEGDARDIRVEFEWQRETSAGHGSATQSHALLTVDGHRALELSGGETELEVPLVQWLQYQMLQGAGVVPLDAADDEARDLLDEHAAHTAWLLSFLCTHPVDAAYDVLSATMQYASSTKGMSEQLEAAHAAGDYDEVGDDADAADGEEEDLRHVAAEAGVDGQRDGPASRMAVERLASMSEDELAELDRELRAKRESEAAEAGTK